MNLDLIALWGNAEVIRELDFGHDEAVLLREVAAHLAHPLGQFVVRASMNELASCLPRQSSISAVLRDSLTELRASSAAASGGTCAWPRRPLWPRRVA